MRSFQIARQMHVINVAEISTKYYVLKTPHSIHWLYEEYLLLFAMFEDTVECWYPSVASWQEGEEGQRGEIPLNFGLSENCWKMFSSPKILFQKCYKFGLKNSHFGEIRAHNWNVELPLSPLSAICRSLSENSNFLLSYFFNPRCHWYPLKIITAESPLYGQHTVHVRCISV